MHTLAPDVDPQSSPGQSESHTPRHHDWLEAEHRCADMLNPYQNVYCGITIISSYIEKYEGDYGKALMAYNMGDYGARKAWNDGITSTKYSTSILELMAHYEEVSHATGN